MHLPLWDMTNVVVWRVSSLQEFLGQVRYNLINFTTARAVLVLQNVNPLRPKSDQHQISPRNMNAL